MASRKETLEKSGGRFEQVHLRLPADVLAVARTAANRRGVSVTHLLVEALTEGVYVPCPMCHGSGRLAPSNKKAPEAVATPRALNHDPSDVPDEQPRE